MNENHPQIELPIELINSEILPRLSIKTLIQFKSVSKQWNSLISSPQFAKLHLQFQKSSLNPKQFLLINDNDSSFLTFDYTHHDDFGESFDFDENPNEGLINLELGRDLNELIDHLDNRLGISIVGSCDGLVCLDFGISCLVIWNPGTRELRKIDNPSSFRKKETILGFGYVSSLDDFKIVSLSQKLNSCRKKAHTLCLKDGEWVKVDAFEGYNVDSLALPGVLVDEMVFWRMINGFGMLCIVGFDLVNEGFNEVEIPDWVDTLRDFFLCVIGGCLCACWKDNEGSVEIAMLKEYGDWGSWTKLYQFDCDRFYCCDLFGFTRGGKLVMDTLEGSVLLIDDLGHDFPTYIEILRLNSKKEIVGYVESMLSPFALC